MLEYHTEQCKKYILKNKHFTHKDLIEHVSGNCSYKTLQHTIKNLRKEGYDIKSEWTSSTFNVEVSKGKFKKVTSRFKEYWLCQQEKI